VLLHSRAGEGAGEPIRTTGEIMYCDILPQSYTKRRKLYTIFYFTVQDYSLVCKMTKDCNDGINLILYSLLVSFLYLLNKNGATRLER